MRTRTKRRLRWGWGGAVAALAGLTALALWLDARHPPVLDRYLDRSAVVLDSQGRLLRGYTAADGTWRIAATPDEVSPLYLDMLIAYEDSRFRWHPGVDPLSVLRAAGQWLVHGRPVSGASTLTMQTARLLEPRPRTLRSKLLEMARAIQLEAHFSKDEILAMYLTLAPFGGNIEGVKAAGLAYLGREPAALTPGEAALLVALPQSPSRLRPDRDAEAARRARDKVLRRMAGAGLLTPVAAAEATQQAVPDRRHAMPFTAPHLADVLVAADPEAETIVSTVDGTLQRSVEALTARFAAGLDRRANVAALVVDNRSRAVLAYVGSTGFFEAGRAGQVDLVRATRSPGSTLKPFIYGLAFEDLALHPETLIRDAPRRFGDYSPQNFDPEFAGEISVREALVRSVNVPAVAVLDRVGPARLAARLRAAGAALHFPSPDDEPGLPIALGGVGVSLFDMTTLYAALANGGAAAPLRLAADAPDSSSPRLLAPLAAWYVTDILADALPPGEAVDPLASGTGHRIAYKTGTSYGFRDAWAIGYDADHTVGVWVGRPDGSPSPDRYGRNTAAPLLFRLFDLLPDPARDVVPPPPEGALLAGTDALPPRLRRFEAPPLASRATALAEPPRIDFPIDGTTVELPEPDAPLPLAAVGGTRPLRWLVNGRPVAASAVRRDTAWQPDTRGHVRITVIDARGQTDSAVVWLR